MKRNLFREICLVLSMLLLTLGIKTSQVYAQNTLLTTQKPTSCSFSTAWERTRYVNLSGTSNHVGELCYGFNTYAIDEDYVWTRSVMFKHQSYLIQTSYIYTSTTYNASGDAVWAKLEKAHISGASPAYGIHLIDISNNISLSNFSLGDSFVTNNK